MQTQPILVIGANGKTGRRIVRSLSDKGYTIRPGSRSAKIPFDWDDEATWPPALSGVSTAYISYFPDLAFPGAAEKIAALCALARQQSVGRLVLLSGRGETQAERCEEIVRHSGVDFTLIRCAWFAQNFSEGYLRDPVLDGTIALPAADVQEPIVDVDDIADVAVAALTQMDRHSRELYEITGPRLLHFAQAATELARAIGHPVAYVPITLEQFHAVMSEIGGTFIADVFTHVCEEALDGRNQWLGDGVQRALGRAPRDFTDFCQRAATDGAWRAAA
ncbi:MAG TPA: NmrA family transcriptional regulator [Roseovarius sp.]